MTLKKERWYYLAIGIFLLIFNRSAFAQSLDKQRHDYQIIKQAWDNNQMEIVERLMPVLIDYPLYPYLKYRQLSQSLDQKTKMEIDDFIKHHSTFPLIRTLIERFINELARREDWNSILQFSQKEPMLISARCNWYYAKWTTGQHRVALEGAEKIWLQGISLPSSCDKLFDIWRAARKQTVIVTLERIRLAIIADNSNLVKFLTKQLPSSYQVIAKAIVELQNNPSTIESFVRSMKPTSFTRQITVLAFSRCVQKDLESAKLMIPKLIHLQKMDEKQAQELREIVAWRLMHNNITSEQAHWRDNVITNSNSTDLIERRLRLAISNNDRNALNTWIAHLNSADQEKEEWQYWLADWLMDHGRQKEAESILRKLMQSRGFYPMIAAQRLGLKYLLQIDKTTCSSKSLENILEIARVRELMYWGMNNLASLEWANFVKNKTLAQQLMLARYALNNYWWDLSVQTTIIGKLRSCLVERFPLAWKTQFSEYTSDKEILPSYAMAVARQESAWNPKARSPVGAIGLMQIMPSTANYTAKLYNILGYRNSSQLLDPQINIQIGTQYLEYIYQKFEQNRIFSTAAYNAGPKRVQTWKRISNGKLNAIAFIESIPFSETRNYVKNVLTYDAYYRYLLNQPGSILSEREWRSRY